MDRALSRAHGKISRSGKPKTTGGAHFSSPGPARGPPAEIAVDKTAGILNFWPGGSVSGTAAGTGAKPRFRAPGPPLRAVRGSRPDREETTVPSRERVWVAISGGVDSSVAAWLLKEQGYDVTGVTMRLAFRFPATGHYAWIEESGGQWRLLRARDRGKDQTYFLYPIAAADLGSILFPLAGLMKDEVRELARKAALPVAEKPESQDLCFVPAGGRGEDPPPEAGRSRPDHAGRRGDPDRLRRAPGGRHPGPGRGPLPGRRGPGRRGDRRGSADSGWMSREGHPPSPDTRR